MESCAVFLIFCAFLLQFALKSIIGKIYKQRKKVLCKLLVFCFKMKKHWNDIVWCAIIPLYYCEYGQENDDPMLLQ